MQKAQTTPPEKMPIVALMRLMKHPALGMREKPLRKVLRGVEGYRKATEEGKKNIKKNAFSKISLLLEAEYGAKEAELGHKAGELRGYISKKYMLEREELEERRKFLGYGTDMPFLEGEQELKKKAQEVLCAFIEGLGKREKRERKLLKMRENLAKMELRMDMPDEMVNRVFGILIADALIVVADAMLVAGGLFAGQGFYPQGLAIATFAGLNVMMAALTYASIRIDMPRIRELAGKIYRAIKRAAGEKS